VAFLSGQREVERRHGVDDVLRLCHADDRRGGDGLARHPRQGDPGPWHLALLGDLRDLLDERL